MSKSNIIINFIIFILIADLSSCDKDFIDRHSTNITEKDLNCIEKMNSNDIISSDDCFAINPGRKWKCCYFEFINKDGETEHGCMKYRKNNEADLNDLKDYISKFSSNIMLDCRQNYLIYSIGILFAFLLFLI